MEKLLLVVLTLLLLPISQAPNVYAQPQISVGQAVAGIAALPRVQSSSCEDVTNVLRNGDIVVNYLNQGLSTNFERVKIPPTLSSEQSCATLLKVLPVVSSYNDLILAAKRYDPNNPTTVREFYVKAFLLAAELTIVNGLLEKAAFNIAFKSTGELNNALKLGKLRSLCGDTCYVEVLRSLHWFIRNNVSQVLDDLQSWAGGYLAGTTKPDICSWPFLGWIFTIFHAFGC